MNNQQMCVVPAKCNKCGELFDLSYDFKGSGEEVKAMGVLNALVRSKQKASLCWDCRGMRIK